MLSHLLSVLIFLPIAASLIVLLFPNTWSSTIRGIALAVTIIQVALLVMVVYQYTGSDGTLRLAEQTTWFELSLGEAQKLRVEYFVALDGLNLPLVALSVVVMVFATLSSWNVVTKVKGYFSLLLLLNGAIVGSFVAFDLLLFYLFFEFMLLPMFFLIGIWGGPRREYASVKFFLYTLGGSILILIVFIGLYLSAVIPGEAELIHTFNIVNLQNPEAYLDYAVLDPENISFLGSVSLRVWAFLFLFIGFAIKLPMVPLHTWLPDAHVEAPTGISVVLAALLLKIGGYGLIRIAYPLFPDAAVQLSWLVGLMGVISILYGAMNAMASKDLKRLIAYSSVSHMGFVLLGLASVTVEGVAGSIYQMVSHGLITSMLFVIAGVLYDRTQDRMIENYSGLSHSMPRYFVLVLIAFFASLGLPGFSGFIAEIMVFLGAFKSSSANDLLHPSLAVLSTLGLLLGAGYYLWTLQRMFFGQYYCRVTLSEPLTDLNRRESLILIPLAIMVLVTGIFPHLLLHYINPFASEFVDMVLSSLHNG